VFYGQSSLGALFWGPPFQTNYANDTITGGDMAATNGVVIPSTPGGPLSLLASVQFVIPAGAQLNQFQVSLVNDPHFTYFLDPNGNPLPLAPTGVPEPSSLAVVALSVLSGLVWSCARRRARAQSKKSPAATSLSAR
jgi:hypothetical protein